MIIDADEPLVVEVVDDVFILYQQNEEDYSWTNCYLKPTCLNLS